MDFRLVLFVLFVVFAGFNAGTMTTLQIQHYGIYPQVARESFAAYMRANNKSALVPAVLPALALLIISVLLIPVRPEFMSGIDAAAACALNLVSLASTFIWQRRLQGEMAVTGYDEGKVRLLIATNWIRTCAFLVEAVLAAVITLRAIAPTV